MSGEVHGFGEFYESPAGQATARLLRARLETLWPQLHGKAVLGIGYSAPYLSLWQEEAACCIALSPPQLGTVRRTALANGACVAAEEDRLPFPDLSFDRILLVHGLEAAESARRLLRDVWRVMKDDGKLMVVAPNRRGVWAHSEHTPFGHGEPYSPGQISRLLARHMFRVERREAALFVPPVGWMLRRGQGWDRIGRMLWPEHFAGLVLAEAAKDIFAVIPAGGVRARRQVLADEPA